MQNYDGSSDIKVFLEKVDLHSALKGYDAAKSAQNLGSKLEGPAFNVYLRLSEAEKKDVEKIKEELMKEFQLGNQDREKAMQELTNQHRKPGESPQAFAFKIMELVKLAYASFDNANQDTIAKDYYMQGIHSKMQTALKAMPNFAEFSITDVAKETVRLQLAGIESFSTPQPNHCMNINNATEEINATLVDTIVEKVVGKVKNMSVGIEASTEACGEATPRFPSANFVNSHFNRNPRGRQYANSSISRYNNRGYRQNSPRPNQQPSRICCACQSTDHLVRDCQTQFCQACGQRGHDSWDRSCQNFQ